MQPTNPEDPARLGQFEVLGILGTGGMGRVYFARDPQGHAVAMKVIRADLAPAQLHAGPGGRRLICAPCAADLPRIPVSAGAGTVFAPLAYEYPVDRLVQGAKFHQRLPYARAPTRRKHPARSSIALRRE